MAESCDRYLINSVLRAAQILESFTLDQPTYSNSELAKKIGINKSSATRLLYSLERAGFIVRDRQTGRYSLTYKLHLIGNVYVQNTSLHMESVPLLKGLSAEFNENTHLGMMDRTDVLYLEQVKCAQPIGLMSSAGSRLPAFCTGIGKVLLAYMSDGEFDAYCREADLIRYTENTVVDPEEIRAGGAEIRAYGYSITRGEFRPEVFSVSAPVRDSSGQVVAAISLAGPCFRMDHPEQVERYIVAVTDTAHKISQRLGWPAERKSGTGERRK